VPVPVAMNVFGGKRQDWKLPMVNVVLSSPDDEGVKVSDQVPSESGATPFSTKSGLLEPRPAPG